MKVVVLQYGVRNESDHVKAPDRLHLILPSIGYLFKWSISNLVTANPVTKFEYVTIMCNTPGRHICVTHICIHKRVCTHTQNHA